MRAVGPGIVSHVVSEHNGLRSRCLVLMTPGSRPSDETLVKKKAAIYAALWNFFDAPGVADYFGGGVAVCGLVAAGAAGLAPAPDFCNGAAGLAGAGTPDFTL